MTPASRRLLLVLAIACAAIAILYAVVRVSVGFWVQQELETALGSVSEEQGIELELKEYRRDLFKATAVLRLKSTWHTGDLKLKLTHGPIFRLREQPSWASLELMVRPGVWLPAMVQLADSPAWKNLAPVIQLPRKVRLPDLRFVGHFPVQGGMDGRLELPDFEYRGRLGWPVLAWEGVVANAVKPAGTETLKLDFLAQQFVAEDQQATRLSIQELSLNAELGGDNNQLPRESWDGEVERVEWSRGEAALELGTVELFKAVSEKDWHRELALSIAEARYVPSESDGRSIRFHTSGRLGISGVPPILWQQATQEMANGTADDSLWSDMAFETMQFELESFALAVEGQRGTVSGSARLDPPGEDYAMIYEKLNGDLTIEFDHGLLDLLVPMGVVPYFSAAVNEPMLDGVEHGREELLKRNIAMLVSDGYLEKRGEAQYAATIALSDNSLIINGQVVAAWDE